VTEWTAWIDSLGRPIFAFRGEANEFDPEQDCSVVCE
jgi:hypothetical protein